MIQLVAPREALILGLMSGTSCDGLDLALVHFGPGETDWSLEAFREIPYTSEFRSQLLGAAEVRLPDVSRLHAEIADETARSVAAFLRDQKRPDLVVSHGQTLWHAPAPFGQAGGHTLQLGDGDRLSAHLKLPVLWNLRSGDMAIGGQGAPLVPVADQFLLGRHAPLWLLNVGGIANLTGLGLDGELLGMDVGPGNCLLDRWIEYRTEGRMHCDQDGRFSSAGSPDLEIVRALVEACSSEAGRSLARERFDLEFLLGFLPADGSLEDGAATLIRVTAELIRRAVERAQLKADKMAVAGGGAFNPSLMLCLSAELPGLEITSTDALGLPPAAREAVCFASLGWLFLHGRASNHPPQTGAQRELRLGSLALPL
ncbi:MAG: anhydro-N-acetylmuramic acid kinase [Myxococcales bacterium]|nr:anhydro-N-acetylmuramic acid kinase [Myxococcales bacterium]